MNLRGITKVDTDIFGLLYSPEFVEKQFNDIDFFESHIENEPKEHWTKAADEVIRKVFKESKDSIKVIVEIGVHRPTNDDIRSSTISLIEEKNPETLYLGVDSSDRREILSWGYDNVHFLQVNSNEKETVINKLKVLGHNEIDFLFIDGLHSINQAVSDWTYTKVLSDHGIVGLHDINYHPGPVAIFDAIDLTVFKVEKFLNSGENIEDPSWGLGFAWRI